MAQSHLSYRGHFNALLILGLPLAGGHLAQFAIGLTDTLMLGRYSVEALAAVVLGATLFFVTVIFGSGFAIAVMPMVAEADAKNDQIQIRRITRMAMWLSTGFAVLTFPLFWFAGGFLTLIGQQDHLAQMAQDYLRIAGWGILPALLVGVLKSYLAALGHTRVVFWTTVFAALTNAAANFALIFGQFGAPELGIKGAAIASLIVNVVSIICVVIYTMRVLPHYSLFSRLWKSDTEVMRAVFAIGLPIGLTVLCETSLFGITTTMMGWLGTVPLAAHGIAINIAGLTFMVHLGLSNAATVRAGHAYGARDYDLMARGARMAIWMSVGLAAIFTLVMVSIPDVLIGLFLDRTDPDYDAILQVGVTLMYMAALFQFVDGAQAQALGLLRGVQDTRWPMIIAAFSYWGVGLCVGYGLGFVAGFGGIGVWLGLVAGLATAALLLMWRFWRQKLVALRQDSQAAA